MKILAHEEEEVAVGGLQCYLFESLADSQATVETNAEIEIGGSSDTEAARFSAGALKLLEERGLDCSAFAGMGLVREKDVLKYIEAGATGSVLDASPANPESGHAVGEPVSAAGVPTRTERLLRCCTDWASRLGRS